MHRTDRHVMEEIMAHSIVAQSAYAFRLNADLDPKYAEAADFWVDYLVNHYEAKWRKRTGRATGYPIIEKNLFHPYVNNTQYHHYMFKLTGETAYEVERDRQVGVILRHLMPDGDAYTWLHFVNEMIAPANRGWIHQPVGYSGESLSALADLGFEGVLSTEVMTKIAASVTVNLLDGKSPGIMASDVGSAQRGLYYYPFLQKFVQVKAPDYPRGTAFFWHTRGYALLAFWDSTGEIERMSARLAGDTFLTPAAGALLGAVGP